MTRDPAISAAALDWVIRQRDPAFADWEDFTAWLETDEAHAAAYHEAALLDEDAGQLRPEPRPLADISDAAYAQAEPGLAGAAGRPFGRRTWLSGALAASVLAIAGFGYMKIGHAPDSYRVATALGEIRTVTLKDGSRIAINGGSSLLLSHDAPRRVTLEKGQANFTVVHDESDPFQVAVGDAQIVDVGTVFDVVRSGTTTIVAVSEGAVAYNPGGENIRLDAGKRLSVNDETRDAGIVHVEPSAVGGWRSGQLVYDGAPLDQVVEEVTRTTGVVIRIDNAAHMIRFRGALNMSAKEDRMVADLAALSGTRATHDAEGWTLSK